MHGSLYERDTQVLLPTWCYPRRKQPDAGAHGRVGQLWYERIQPGNWTLDFDSGLDSANVIPADSSRETKEQLLRPGPENTAALVACLPNSWTGTELRTLVAGLATSRHSRNRQGKDWQGLQSGQIRCCETSTSETKVSNSGENEEARLVNLRPALDESFMEKLLKTG